MPHLRTAKLNLWQRRLLGYSGALLWLTGVAWLFLHHYGQTEGEFGPQMNPAEPWMMKLHGLFMLPALLGIGGLFLAHIPKGWGYRSQRAAGIGLSAFLILLALTGYLLYYAGGEDLRAAASLVHWSLGLGLPLVVAWHVVNAVKLRKAKRRPVGSDAAIAIPAE